MVTHGFKSNYLFLYHCSFLNVKEQYLYILFLYHQLCTLYIVIIADTLIFDNNSSLSPDQSHAQQICDMICNMLTDIIS